ncbi:MAG: (deoxy)nucleoside triphosphate pyrophosphohydrolase [Spirochaetales bacterium]|nr:(deoxy)nucleoside triphosphate pyrophosphohydrolase [Spirochaetales bacterium]
MTTPLAVSAAWLEDEKGRVLLCRRNDDKARGGLWEFPGGKLEDGETPQEAVEREIGEELGLTAEAGEILARTVHDYGDIRIDLILVRMGNPRGTMVLTDHSEVRWCDPLEIEELDLAPADRELLEKRRKP